MSEGDPGNWAAVARAVSDRVCELGWRQRELAVRSRAPVAVEREIRRPVSAFFLGIFLPCLPLHPESGPFPMKR